MALDQHATPYADDGDRPAAARDALETALPRLAAFLRDGGAIGTEPLEIARRFTAGQSNPTYLLRCGQRQLVLRKQPDGPLLPRAHDVARESRIVDALGEAGFTVPRVRAASEDRGIVGTAFYIMDFVPGTVHSDASLPLASRQDRAAIYDGLFSTLAALHAIDPAILAPAGVRPRDGFVGRQVGTWRDAYRASQTREDDRIETVAARLLGRMPADEGVAIVHGDYRMENVIFDGVRPTAVLDWELCTIGEPLSDLAYCCLWHHFPADILNGLGGLDLDGLGIPEEAAILDRYTELGGRDPHATHRYFLAFAFYRLAAILQGVYKRGLDGNAASPDAVRRGRIAEYCLGRAEEFLD